ncbi:MAG: hypothetical protein F4226_00610 [Synechococcus sp. SB0678_bin_12]|nr:hypothetical protein [Synechococcus sp. SB0678_bin_12]
MSLVQKVIDSVCSVAFKFPGELVNEISNCNAMIIVSRGDPGDKVRVERKIIELAQRGRNRPTRRCPCPRGCGSTRCCYGTGHLHGLTGSHCSTFPGGLEPLASFLTRSLDFGFEIKVSEIPRSHGKQTSAGRV